MNRNKYPDFLDCIDIFVAHFSFSAWSFSHINWVEAFEYK